MNHHYRLSSTLGTLALLASAHLVSAAPASIHATLETRPHFDDASGNFADADDPAIWIHPQVPTASLIAGTLKKGGLDIYALDGKLLQHIPPRPAPTCPNPDQHCENASGRLNNVDVVYSFPFQGRPTDLMVASDRGLDTLAIFALLPDDAGQYQLTDITDPAVQPIFNSSQTEINAGYTAYGLATYDLQGKTMALVSQNSTTQIAILELQEGTSGGVGYTLESRLNFPHEFAVGDQRWTPCSGDSDHPQFEGMVADPAHNALYLAQENVGIWRIAMDAPQDRDQWQLFARVAEFGVPYDRHWNDSESEYSCSLHHDRDPGLGDLHLQADLEGLTVYDAGEGRGYLLVSSQGDNTVAVYERGEGNRYIGSFQVGNGSVDGVNETDGMMVTSVPLGDAFPAGVLVMHDGDNQPQVIGEHGVAREGSNFKFIDWTSIANALNLQTNSGNRVRSEP